MATSPRRVAMENYCSGYYQQFSCYCNQYNFYYNQKSCYDDQKSCFNDQKSCYVKQYSWYDNQYTVQLLWHPGQWLWQLIHLSYLPVIPQEDHNGICGCPLELSNICYESAVCRKSKRSCNKHIGWEKLRLGRVHFNSVDCCHCFIVPYFIEKYKECTTTYLNNSIWILNKVRNWVVVLGAAIFAPSDWTLFYQIAVVQ